MTSSLLWAIRSYIPGTEAWRQWRSANVWIARVIERLERQYGALPPLPNFRRDPTELVLVLEGLTKLLAHEVEMIARRERFEQQREMAVWS